jgi:hypothetical protein
VKPQRVGLRGLLRVLGRAGEGGGVGDAVEAAAAAGELTAEEAAALRDYLAAPPVPDVDLREAAVTAFVDAAVEDAERVAREQGEEGAAEALRHVRLLFAIGAAEVVAAVTRGMVERARRHIDTL